MNKNDLTFLMKSNKSLHKKSLDMSHANLLIRPVINIMYIQKSKESDSNSYPGFRDLLPGALRILWHVNT